MSEEERPGTLAGCVAYVLGASESEVPQEGELALRQWLSGRNLGMVHSEPADGFTWPGYFLARRREVGEWAVLFGAPPGVVFDPGGHDPAFDSLSGAFDSLAFLTPYELEPLHGKPLHGVGVAPPKSGVARLIAIADSAEAPMREVERVEALAGRGLRGDRYERKAGTFSDPGGLGYDLTLVESEALRGLRSKSVGLPAAEARRNIVTEGIELDALIGRRFRVGDVECFGQRRCEPCAHLERLTRPDVLRGLIHRGGLRADILSGGEIRVGDKVEAL